MQRLIDVVSFLDGFDPEWTIYVTEPWDCQSDAVVLPEPEEGGLPADAKARGATYFIEVRVASELLEGFDNAAGLRKSPRERCERLIRYARDDA